jgi:membrane associated rhomboid family serine protease
VPQPYRDDSFDSGPRIGLPGVTPVVQSILWTNVVIGVLFLFLGGNATFAKIHEVLALDIDAWREHFPLVPVWQLATFGFLHSTGDPMHLVMNMIGLYFLGTMLEGILGSRRFAVLYGAGVLVPAVLQLAVALSFDQHLLVVGASGAVLALVVALATMRPHALFYLLLAPVKLWVIAVVYVMLDLFGLVRGGGDAAHVVHLGGAALGFAAVKLHWVWYDPFAALEARREAKVRENAQDDAQRLDELLARIHRDGIGSLSEREKAFLKRMSSRRDG